MDQWPRKSIIGMNGDEEADATVGRGSHNLDIGEDHAYSNTHGILHGYQTEQLVECNDRRC